MKNVKPFTDVTWFEFLKFKFTNPPSIKNARMWKDRFKGGAMSTHEFAEFVANCGYENALIVDANRKRSLFGYYIDEWIKWITFWSRHEYNEIMYNQYIDKLKSRW